MQIALRDALSRCALAALALGTPASAQDGPAGARGADLGPEPPAAADASEAAPKIAQIAEIEWNARHAEHLLNRAGFGARQTEVDRAVRRGLKATVDELLDGRGQAEPFFLDAPDRLTRAEKKDLTTEERRDLRNKLKREDRALLDRFADWWITEMIQGPHPLREHLTLFWHGHFTSSFREVKNGEALIQQNELFRREALGSFDTLVREVLRDPAMLLYLDNDENTKKNPNENLARELLELFTLGEGHYSERDVKEAARALTGWDVVYPEGAVFRERRHDRGKKRVLGTNDKLDLDGLVDVILARKACSLWLAGRLLVYFEGREPDGERLEHYARLLRRKEYELRPFLRALFLDPEFYSESVVGARITGPIEFLVGASRRLGLAPPGCLVWISASQLGQRLFDPPSVKGWDGGRAWITTSTFLQRGNMIGLLLGVVSFDEVVAPEEGMYEETEMDAESPMSGEAVAMGKGDMDDSFALNKRVMGREYSGMKRLLDGRNYWPRIHLAARCGEAGARYDSQIVEFLCDELLAVEVTSASRAALASFLSAQRADLQVADGALLSSGAEAEHTLRRLAHLVLSLPEANLN